MKPLSPHHNTGSTGESIAILYLQKNGYRIIERNYRTSLGEIDVLCSKGMTVYAVEVKTTALESGEMLRDLVLYETLDTRERIDEDKVARIDKTLLRWRSEKNYSGRTSIISLSVYLIHSEKTAVVKIHDTKNVSYETIPISSRSLTP